MTKILLTGKDGQVGKELEEHLKPLGNVISLGRSDLNLQDLKMIKQIMQDIKPNIVVNAAAYTAVDKAENDEDVATLVNAKAPKVLAEEAKLLGSTLVHYSTDYVFDGISKNTPFLEDDKPNPLNVYGKTKLQGEKFIQSSDVNHLIFRTSWVYGLRGKNFLLTMLGLAKEKDQLSIVADQHGAPTWSASIAKTTAQILKQCIEKNSFKEVSGLYHLTSSGITSWHGFAEEIFKLFKEHDEDFKIPALNKIITSEYPLPACRPLYSALSNEKLASVFNVQMPDWKDALRACINRRN